MDTKEEAGRRIKTAREAKNMTLQQVSDAIPGISKSRLSNWEQGTRMIGVDEAKRLAQVLGVSAGYLLTLEDAPKDNRGEILLKLFYNTDKRGQESVLRVAEAESAYAGRREDESTRHEPGELCG